MSATTSKGRERVWFQTGLNPLFFTTAVHSDVTREGGDTDVDVGVDADVDEDANVDVDVNVDEGESDREEVGRADSDMDEAGALGIPTTVEEEVLLASAFKEESVLALSGLKGERAQSGTKIETST